VVYVEENAVTLDLLATADEIRAMASNGLLFTKDPYDRERYERLLVLAAEMASSASTLPAENLLGAWQAEGGYITPKVGVAAAVHGGPPAADSPPRQRPVGHARWLGRRGRHPGRRGNA